MMENGRERHFLTHSNKLVTNASLFSQIVILISQIIPHYLYTFVSNKSKSNVLNRKDHDTDIIS